MSASALNTSSASDVKLKIPEIMRETAKGDDEKQ